MPAILWMIGVAAALLVCGVTIWQSHYFDGHADDVRAVSWSMIGAHFVTLVMVALPYPIYLLNAQSLSAHSRGLYERLGWPSAIVAIALIMLELALMYMQARRAWRAEDKRKALAGDGATSVDDGADARADREASEDAKD
ncbi:MAG: C4-dicarboxylate ABC transporter [Bifidobacterium sp.]|nr:C4-dicarboxylate ABC transporter [Bifidobacterium sp.]